MPFSSSHSAHRLLTKGAQVVNNLIQSLLVPVIVVVGLIVLVALGKVSAVVAVPVITGLAGVHLGANLPATLSTPTTTVAAPPSKPVIQ